MTGCQAHLLQCLPQERLSLKQWAKRTLSFWRGCCGSAIWLQQWKKQLRRWEHASLACAMSHCPKTKSPNRKWKQQLYKINSPQIRLLTMFTTYWSPVSSTGWYYVAPNCIMNSTEKARQTEIKAIINSRENRWWEGKEKYSCYTWWFSCLRV